jgi:BMFP domain-containing protein YqiC
LQLAQTRFGVGFDTLAADRKAAVREEMQRQLQTLDLTQREVTVPEALRSVWRGAPGQRRLAA